MDDRLDNLPDSTEKTLDYWQQKLANALPLLELPYDHQRPASQNYHMGTQLLPLDNSTVEQLATLAENQVVPTSTIVLATLQTLLGRYTGQEDVLIGVPVVDKGKLINLVPLRTIFDEGFIFTDALQRLVPVLEATEAHQTLPFHTLVQELRITPDPSHHPLFQVLFAHNESLTIGNLHALTPVKCDLTCLFKDTQIIFAYDKTLFKATTIERFIGHFQILLQAILANPQQTLASYPLLTDAEYQQLLVEWNANQINYEPACVHQLFEAQVEKTPDAIAAIFENQRLTFRELNSRANQIAHYLREQGVRAESFVGVCVERSLYLAIGALGVLKAGGAYVSLDPAYPKKRLQFMLQDTQISTLLTQQLLVAELPESQAKPICLDTEWSIFEPYSTDNLSTEVTWDNLAYVIYTSGSTGNPKGVMITHRNLVDYILSIRVPMEINDQDVYLQTASFGFSSSVRQLFVPLTQGASIVVASSEQRLNPIELFKLIQTEKVTIIDLVPSHWRQCIDALGLLSESEQQTLLNNDLRLFLSASEPLLSDLPKRWRQELKHPARLINMFGQTETTGIATTYPIPETEDEKVKTVAVGRPMANAQIYLLNSAMQPVPIGVYGEMYIGGTHVGRGYLNLAENTAANFIPDIFSQDEHAILYKTGDLARYLADGTIEFLGRRDNQVKIRGFRIELGEVEATLTQHVDIRSAVVMAREDNPGNKRLVGYVVLKPERELHVSALRQFMQEKLPDYMVPAAFVVLEAIPLTPNGKIDRRALPAPDTSVENLEGGFVVPTNPTEETLAEIWAKVLRLDKVGIHNNFFELGGDSILGIQIIAQANQAGLAITARQLFEHQTVAELASVVGTTEAVETEQGMVTGLVTPTPIYQWFFARDLPQAHHFNQSRLLEIPKQLNPKLMAEAVQVLIQHHDALRFQFKRLHANLPVWQCENAGVQASRNSGIQEIVWQEDIEEVTWEEMLTFPIAWQREFVTIDLSGHEAKQLPKLIYRATDAVQASLGLEGPLIRVALLKLDHGETDRLFFAIHHLVVDGVSWRLVLEDFASVYKQLEKGEPIELPPKTTPFREWGYHLVNYLLQHPHREELTHWLTQLQYGVTPLPYDRPKGQNENTIGSSHDIPVSLSTQETQALLQEIPPVYNTHINDVLLTALLLGCTEWLDEKFLVLHLEGHGREELPDNVNLSRTVGWFTSIFPVLLTLDNAEEVGSTLKSVKEQLNQIPNKGITYGLLTYLSQDSAIRNALQSLPKVVVRFNYLGQFDQVLTEYPFIRLADEFSGVDCARAGKRDYPIDINGFVANDQLRIYFTYSENIFNRGTVEKLAQGFIEALRKVIHHCQTVEEKGYTPSDFPTAKLTQAQLDRVLNEVHSHAGVQDLSCKTPQIAKKIDSLYPLTPTQQGILFETLAATEGGIHIEQSVWDFHGHVDLDIFRQTWQMTLDKHPILRTVYAWDRLDEPVQIVLNQVAVPFIYEDWQQASDTEQTAKFETWLQEDRLRGFNMNQAPLIRLALFQLTESHYYFVWTFHHILIDGWSGALIWKDVLAYHQALSEQFAPQLESNRSYEDYFIWLKKQDLSQAQTFWQHMLNGFIEPNGLGKKVEIPAEKAERGYGVERIHLSETETTKLQTLVKQHRFTLNNITQAVWALLLARYSQRSDIVFGTTVSGRPPLLQGVESIVGMMINAIPLRLSIDPQQNLWDWLKHIQTANLERQDYEYCSTGQIHAWSDISSALPLYDTLFVFENYPEKPTALQAKDHRIGLHNQGTIGAQTKYTLSVLVTPETELECKIIFDKAHFDASNVRLILEQFMTLLNHILENPEITLENLQNSISDSAIPTYYEVISQPQSQSDDVFEDKLEIQVSKIVAKILHVPNIGRQDNFFDMGGTSLLAVNLLAEVEQAFGRQDLSLMSIFQAPTVAQLAGILRQENYQPAWRIIEVIQPEGSKPPLFFVGSTRLARSLLPQLGNDQPVYGINVFGVQPTDGSLPDLKIENLAAQCVAEIQSVQPHGPYHIASYCGDAKTALEMGQQLYAKGEKLNLLAFFDGFYRMAKKDQDYHYFKHHFDNLSDMGWRYLSHKLRQKIHGQTRNLRLKVLGLIGARKQRYHAHGEKLSTQLQYTLFINRYLDELTVYKPKRYPGKLTLFYASEWRFQQTHSIEKLAQEGIEIITVKGYHDNLFDEPQATELGQKLKIALDCFRNE